MATETKTITKAELEKHNDEKDCWLAIGGKVYDVTKFLDNHPGGPEIVYEHAGTDATDEFEDIGHSEDARRQLNDYVIGDLDGAAAKPTSQSTVTTGKPEGGNSLYLLIALFVAAVAVYLNFAA